IRLFAEYDRDLLLTFLKSSEVYSFDKAAEICEKRHYIPELVHILSKTGQTKRALFLIIGELGDVSQAIAFAKEHPDLW
ncbi:UNVERIFIED_CONTAM: CLH domain-containing protein, partial [Bacteroidetes bacterium 56_B9]